MLQICGCGSIISQFHGAARWDTEKTLGIGSPDVELVAGLTRGGFLYSVGYICTETQTHTTKEEAV